MTPARALLFGPLAIAAIGFLPSIYLATPVSQALRIRRPH